MNDVESPRSRAHRSRSILLGALASLSIGLLACSGAAIATTGDASGADKTGEMVDGPSNPFRFAPAAAVAAVEADEVDFKSVFEQLGPHAADWHQHVQTLANPFFEGRLPGSEGHKRAAEYIEFCLRELELEPAFAPADGDGDSDARTSYRQPFTFFNRTTDRDVEAMNIAGVIPGQGPLADEWIVIGAHYDHVGDGSMGGVRPNNRGQMHLGADDNASGTAGALVLAHMLAMDADAASETGEARRSVLVLFFDAEEMGLHGSRYFAEHPSIPLERTSILINLDMIGRLRNDEVAVLGTGTAAELESVMQPHIEASGLTVGVTPAGSGRSDDANFHEKNVPAVHFFTGMTREYTTPRDLASTLNPVGAGKLLDLLRELANDIATRPAKLEWQDPPRSRGQDRGYARVRLGIRPGMADDLPVGIRIAQVQEGTTAELGGIKDGDVLLKWNGKTLSGLRALFEIMQEHQPGDKVKVVVLRDDQEIELELTLQASSGRNPRSGGDGEESHGGDGESDGPGGGHG